jgi:hypothetical protein
MVRGMSNKSLEDRGRALEDEFFYKEEQKKLAQLREKEEAKASREELKKVSGMTDDAVLDKLSGMGLRANTVAALSLVPLIAVAWADGSIQDQERVAILAAAEKKGLGPGTPGAELLGGWLSRKPDDSLFETWESYIKALAAQLTEDQIRKLRGEIVGFAKLVAGSAGGVLGIAKVSGKEEKVLERIEGAFAK